MSEYSYDETPAALSETIGRAYERGRAEQRAADEKEMREKWTDRFRDDLRAASEEEHRPRGNCSGHRSDDCCLDCCTTCIVLETAAAIVEVQRAADIAKIEALLEPWTWRNYMGRFSPPRNAGLQAALDTLREGDTT